MSLKATGKMIVLAFPDTFVTMSDEWICRFLPWVGLGTRKYIKAGHAALVLIENASGVAHYYDFGRYVTPKGYGRVRSVHTDAELEIPFKAQLDASLKLQNLEDFLLWLEAHPQKTHGQGRLLASICDTVDYDRAKQHIQSFQAKGSIPYGAFYKTGSNCSRFVTDTILASTQERKIHKKLRFNKKFTPSTIGNVEIAATNGKVFEVFERIIRPFAGSAFKENLKNYFQRKKHTGSIIVEAISSESSLQKLEGIGSSAYFELVASNLPSFHFRIKRYNDLLEEDFDGVFYSEEFIHELPYTFTYDSHCGHCHVIQLGKKIKLSRVDLYVVFREDGKNVFQSSFLTG